MYSVWKNGRKFDKEKYKRAISKILDYPGDCRFVVVPDVLTDSQATIAQYRRLAPEFREYGLPLAFVSQDGLTRIPDDIEYDALFIGGTDEHKNSQALRDVVRQAKQDEKWVHMGRVNALKRLEYAYKIGCDSVDGTTTAKEPRNIVKVCAWINALHAQRELF
jgi:hypothetical protein